LVFFIKFSYSRRFRYLELEARAKAKAIEQEAEKLRQESEVELRRREFEAQKEINSKIEDVERRNRSLILKEREFDEKIAQLNYKEAIIDEKVKNIQKLEDKKKGLIKRGISKKRNWKTLIFKS